MRITRVADESAQTGTVQPLPHCTGPHSPEGHGLTLFFLESLLTNQPPSGVDSWGPSCMLLLPVTPLRCPLGDSLSSELLWFMGCPPCLVPRCQVPCGRVTACWPPSRHPAPALVTSSAWTPRPAVNQKQGWGPGWSCRERGPLGPQIDRRIIAASGEGGGMEVPFGGKLAWK